MGKLACKIDFGGDGPRRRNANNRKRRRSQSRKGPGVHKLLGKDYRAAVLRGRRRQNRLDDKDPPVQRGDRGERDGGRVRVLSDEDLSSTVRIIQWDNELLERATYSILYSGARYDHSAFTMEPIDIAKLLVTLQGSTFALGRGGVAFFNPLIPGFHGLCHLYIWDRQYLRRTDLMKATLKWSFKNWDLQRIHCIVPKRNILSWRYAEKLGFTREGTLRNLFLYNGGVDDGYMYGLLPGEV